MTRKLLDTRRYHPLVWIVLIGGSTFACTAHADQPQSTSNDLAEPTKQPDSAALAKTELERPVEPPPQPATHPQAERKTLTGDWNGTRTELEEKGISLSLAYNQQFQQNFRGGLDTHNGHRLSGSYDLVVKLDFEKMNWLEDAGFFIETKGTWSDGINPNKVGALYNVNQDAGDDHPIFVNKWWVWKKFADKKIELRLGLLESNKDLFDVSPYANHEDKDFINRLSIRNVTIPHRTANGLFLKWQPVEWLYFQGIGLDSAHQPRTTGWDTAFHDQATFVGMWEAGVRPKWNSAKGPMPGDARVGLWYDPSSKTIFRNTIGGRLAPERDTGDVGYYFGFDQLVWKENGDTKDKQGLGVYGRYGHAHADRNRTSDYWSLGLSYLGLIPERNADVMGLGVAQAILSERYRDDVHPLADRETAYEWYYSWQITPWFIVSPHVQFVTNPGGDKDDRDAIIGGFRIRVLF